MPGLVHRAEQGCVEEIGLVARRNANVVAGERYLEWMDRAIQTSPLEIVAEGGGDALSESLLLRLREVLVQDGIVDRFDALPDGLQERHQLALEVREDRLYLGRLHPGLIDVQKSVIELILVAEMLGHLAAQLDRLLE